MAEQGLKTIAVGDEVFTPDGKGKVIEIGDRYVTVELESKIKAALTSREIFLDEAHTLPANIPSPETPAKTAPEPTPEPANGENAQ